MIATELQTLAENPEWGILLESYQSGISAAKQADAEFNGWLPRLRQIEGIEGESLSSIHGKLIAYGFLKFQLADRTMGICYQLSALGKKALSTPLSQLGIADEDDNETEDSEADSAAETEAVAQVALSEATTEGDTESDATQDAAELIGSEASEESFDSTEPEADTEDLTDLAETQPDVPPEDDVLESLAPPESATGEEIVEDNDTVIVEDSSSGEPENVHMEDTHEAGTQLDAQDSDVADPAAELPAADDPAEASDVTNQDETDCASTNDNSVCESVTESEVESVMDESDVAA